MSMLQAQCDELRAMAVSVGFAMPQAATLMMEAADTIDCLDAENAKLRELLGIVVHCCNEVDGCDTCGLDGDPYEVASHWFACDALRDRLREVGVRA